MTTAYYSLATRCRVPASPACFSVGGRSVIARQSSMGEGAITEVERAGGRLVSRGERAPGETYAYVEDPDGYVIEL